MPFTLHTTRTIQAAGVLLKEANMRQMGYMRLLKLLYLTDRKCLQESGSPITGDSVMALKNGPVLSQVYNIIMGRHFKSGKWDEFISRNGYTLHLDKDPGNGELSRFQIRKLQETSQEHAELDDWELVDVVCHNLPEWVKNQPDGTTYKSRPISLDDILNAVGRLAQKDEIVHDAREVNALNRFMSALAK